MWEKGTRGTVVGLQPGIAIMKNSMEESQKLKNHAHMTQQLHLWKYVQRKQKHYTKETSKQPHVQGSNIHNIQNMELTWVSIDGEWIKRLWHIQRSIIQS